MSLGLCVFGSLKNMCHIKLNKKTLWQKRDFEAKILASLKWTILSTERLYLSETSNENMMFLYDLVAYRRNTTKNRLEFTQTSLNQNYAN